MHADTLYHRMLAQEAAITAANEAGEPIPEFPPLLSSSKKGKTAVPLAEPGQIRPEQLSDKVQAGFKKRLEKLSGEELELEKRAIRAEMKAGEEVLGTLGSLYEKQDAERAKRKEQGQETISDRIISIFRIRK